MVHEVFPVWSCCCCDPPDSDPNMKRGGLDKGEIRFEFGPPVQNIPYTHFIEDPTEYETWQRAWHLVGPTIEQNYRRGRIQPYQLYCIAFIEGMRMALTVTGKGEESGNPKSVVSREPERIQGLGSSSRVEYSTYPRECLL